MNDFYQSPDYKKESYKNIEEVQDCHYSSLVFGGKPLFDMLAAYYGDKGEGELIGISVTDNTLNVVFKNKEPDNPERELTGSD